MKKTFCAMLLALVASLGTSVSAECNTPENADTLATNLASGLNQSRRANGEGLLQFNRELARAAMRHACDMLENDFFAHQGSDGSSVQERVTTVGYRPCVVAENIAWGYPRAEQIIDGWMNSQGHRRNMLHPRIEEFGIGITQGPRGPYWVLVVGKKC